MSHPAAPRRFLTHHLPALGWAALLAALLLTPTGGAAGSPWPIVWLFGLSGFWMDIAAHFFLFGMMGWLAGRSIRTTELGRTVLVAIVVSLAYGVLLELAQQLVPGRAFQGMDVAVNGVGAVAGAWLSGRSAG